MDTYKVTRGLSGDPNYYVVKIYGDGTAPIVMCSTGTSQGRADTICAALIAAL